MEPLIIKKYSNRRLYFLKEKRYITLEQLSELIQEGQEVQVIDNQTKQDITQETLLQIILTNDKKTQSLFSSALLHQLIRLKEEHFQEFLRFYLMSGLDYFAKFRQNMNQQVNLWGEFWKGAMPFSPPGQEQQRQYYEKRIEELEEKLRVAQQKQDRTEQE